MKKWLLLVVSVFLVGCAEKIPHLEEYVGQSLEIAVIGEAPDVREKNVTFKEIQLEDLLFIEIGDYDGVFVMKDYLQEASAAEYAGVYTQSKIPFFFIEATKGTNPFIYADQTYNETPEYGDGLDFAAGYVSSSDPQKGSTSFTYGLYNDIKNEETIKGTYSIILKEIEKHVK